MRLNPLPFVFAPGVALAGVVVDGWRGAQIATLVWTAIVALATLAAFFMRKR